MLRFIVVLAVAAATAQAGLLQVPTLTSQDANIYRSYGNLGQVSTSSKTISTPYSSVTKSDVRVSNPGYRVASIASPIGYSAGSPVVSSLGYAGSPLLTRQYAPAAAVATYSSAPATYSTGPLYSGLAPAVARVQPAGLLGVAYSAAPQVSHVTYSNGLGINYGW